MLSCEIMVRKTGPVADGLKRRFLVCHISAVGGHFGGLGKRQHLIYIIYQPATDRVAPSQR
ncbi:hypothetical protein, partial [Acerihabitans sp.]|uniref:hypothetical protein n=1 Tax=Acerihabitans sp. TaxID=2811394 RepID=UPI002ED8278D